MAMTLEEVEALAGALPVEDQARLAEWLRPRVEGARATGDAREAWRRLWEAGAKVGAQAGTSMVDEVHNMRR